MRWPLRGARREPVGAAAEASACGGEPRAVEDGARVPGGEAHAEHAAYSKAAQTDEERANKVIPRAFFMLSISAPISTTYRAPAHSITPQPHPAQGFMTSVAAVLRQRIRRRSARKKKAQEAAKKLLLAGCPICRSLSPAAQHQSG